MLEIVRQIYEYSKQAIHITITYEIKKIRIIQTV